MGKLDDFLSSLPKIEVPDLEAERQRTRDEADRVWEEKRLPSIREAIREELVTLLQQLVAGKDTAEEHFWSGVDLGERLARLR